MYGSSLLPQPELTEINYSSLVYFLIKLGRTTGMGRLSSTVYRTMPPSHQAPHSAFIAKILFLFLHKLFARGKETLIMTC